MYLILDLYPLVPQSASVMVTSGVFWLFWIVQCVLSLLAYAALKVTAGAKIDAAFGAGFSPFAMVFFAVVGNLIFVQSFSLKIAAYKPLDLQKPLESFRTTVLEDISKKVADRTTLQRMRVADRLHAKYSMNTQGLREEYAHVMSQMGLDTGKIGKSLTQLEHEALAADLSLERLLAQRIAQVNMGRAHDLLNG